MKAPRTFFLSMMLASVSVAQGQNVRQEPQGDPVLEGIEEFNQRDKAASEGVTVVTEEAKETPRPAKEEAKQAPAGDVGASESAPSAPGGTPVFVNGRPPEGDSPAAPEEAAAEPETPLPEEQPKEPEEGLAVRVEKLHGGIGTFDAKNVKLKAPFPAKPLAQAPAGWHLEAKNSAPAFTREIELEPGSKITLSIRPHLLVPDADGANVFSVTEPGYDNSLGYQQAATVGAILSNSIRHMDEDSKRLGAAIDSLQQLLISLPKAPEPQAATPEAPAPKTAPIRKR